MHFTKTKRTLLMCLVIGLLGLTGCCMQHDWADATCTEPQTCTKCGETQGEPLGHQWTEATCTEPKTCSVCGATEGESLGHQWIDATYDAPKTCSVCGATEGEKLEREIAINEFKVFGLSLSEISGMTDEEFEDYAVSECSAQTDDGFVEDDEGKAVLFSNATGTSGAKIPLLYLFTRSNQMELSVLHNSTTADGSVNIWIQKNNLDDLTDYLIIPEEFFPISGTIEENKDWAEQYNLQTEVINDQLIAWGYVGDKFLYILDKDEVFGIGYNFDESTVDTCKENMKNSESASNEDEETEDESADQDNSNDKSDTSAADTTVSSEIDTSVTHTYTYTYPDGVTKATVTIKGNKPGNGATVSISGVKSACVYITGSSATGYVLESWIVEGSSSSYTINNGADELIFFLDPDDSGMPTDQILWDTDGSLRAVGGGSIS